MFSICSRASCLISVDVHAYKKLHILTENCKNVKVLAWTQSICVHLSVFDGRWISYFKDNYRLCCREFRRKGANMMFMKWKPLILGGEFIFCLLNIVVYCKTFKGFTWFKIRLSLRLMILCKACLFSPNTYIVGYCWLSPVSGSNAIRLRVSSSNEIAVCCF